jgi:hypothetical protein
MLIALQSSKLEKKTSTYLKSSLRNFLDVSLTKSKNNVILHDKISR